MNPDSRFSASLVLSLALSSPALLSAYRGETDVTTAGLRYLVAFAVAWTCVGFIGRMYNNYVADLEVAKEASLPIDASRRASDAKPAALGIGSPGEPDADEEEGEEGEEELESERDHSDA